MIDPVAAETIGPLLEVADNHASLGTRLDALDVATRLLLDEDAWSAVASAARGALADADPGSIERRRALVVATRIPLLSVRRALREIAADADDPDAHALCEALTKARDPSQVPRLLEEVKHGRDEAFESLATMPLERTGITPDQIPSISEDADPDTRVWRALAVARLGRFEAIDAVLKAFDWPPMFWADPWTPHDRIAAMRPVPPPMRMHLLNALSAGHTSEVGRRIVWAVTGVADAEGTPTEEWEEAPAEPTADEPAASPQQVVAARAAAERVLASLTEKMEPASGDLDALEHLPPDEAAGFVISLITEGNRLGIELPWDVPREILLGNPILDIVVHLRATEEWPVAELFGIFSREGLRGALPVVLDSGQMAWVIARAPIGSVVAELASRITTATTETEPERIAWLAVVADTLAGRAGSPWRGEGPGGSDVVGPTEYLIDDTGEMTVRAFRGTVDSLGGDFVGRAKAVRGDQVLGELRRVHAQIRHGELPRNTFLAGADNVVRCWIGLPDPESGAVADTVIPYLDLPPQGLTLDAVLRWKDQTDHGTLHLPADRTARSSECDLHIHVPDNERFVSAEIAFLYRGRAFEVVHVEAFVLPSGAVAQPYHTVEVKVQVAQREVVELADSQEVDAVMIYGEDRTRVDSPDGRGPTALQTYSSASGASFDLKAPDDIIHYLNTELFVAETSLVRQRERLGQTEEVLDSDADDVLRIFRTLARHGAAIYNSLGDGFVDPGPRIEHRNDDPKEYSPVEFVYDRGYPTDDATICPEGLAALESDADDCPHCPSAADLPADVRIANPLICPFGFWSLQKIIERRDAVPHGGEVSGGQSFPLPDRRHLPPIDSVLFASSAKVPPQERDQTWQRLEALLPHADRAPSWTKWRESLENRLPSLLLALPHHDVEGGLDYLEIGDAELPKNDRRLFRGQIIKEFVNPYRREPGPIVLLLGCHTGTATDIGYVAMARRFQQLPTSIVLGTLAKILGRHAAPVAREIVGQLASVEDPETDFGTVMRRMRRRMLARGYLMALCLVALGDAEWRLTPRP